MFVKVFLSTLRRSFIGSIFQSRLWTTLREYALGVSGCPLRVDRVMYLPKSSRGPSAFPVTWTLDAAALQQSLSARSTSVHLIASLLSAPQNRMKAAEFIGLLKDLFTDIDLVHAAYYSRDSGIRQVAAWIEMSPEEKQIRSQRLAILDRIDFAGYATHVSLQLAGYRPSDLADDRAMLETLEERERHLLTSLSNPAREAYDERTRDAFHPFAD